MKLINRILSPKKAKEALFELINFQLNEFRIENFRRKERFGSESGEAIEQINNILSTKKELIDIINKANAEGKKVLINATIDVEVVEEIENKL